MKRFYFSRTAAPHPVFARSMVAGVVEAETLDLAKAAMAETFRSRASVERVENFEFTDLDGVRGPVGGILATTVMG